LAAIATSVGVSPLRRGVASAQGALPPPAVSVTPVVSRQLTETGDFIGRVTAIDKVDIVARVTGFIEERSFNEGQQVKTGDLLFRIEQATYKAVPMCCRRRHCSTRRKSISVTRKSVHRSMDGSGLLISPWAIWSARRPGRLRRLSAKTPSMSSFRQASAMSLTTGAGSLNRPPRPCT
jgi:hypothetical protein